MKPPTSTTLSPTLPQQTHTLLLKLAPSLSQPLHPADFVAELYASGQVAPGQTPCTVRCGVGRRWLLLSNQAAAGNSTWSSPSVLQGCYPNLHQLPHCAAAGNGAWRACAGARRPPSTGG